jgi:hypothetical protein
MVDLDENAVDRNCDKQEAVLWLTPKQVADQAQVSTETVLRWCNRKKVPSTKLFGQWRVWHGYLQYPQVPLPGRQA